MEEVAILGVLGAGELGGLIAHVLGRRDVVRTIRMIDAAGPVAAGKALDLMQASPIEGFATRVVGSADVASAAGANVIVVADRAGGSEWQGDEGLLMLRRVSEIARDRVTVCAGASQRELVERGVRELGFRPERLIGSAPEALASAMRALVAVECNGSPSDVALTVLGAPPAATVISWEDATIGGFAATNVLDEPQRRRLAAKVAPLWPPGPYALASAAAEAVAAFTGRSRRTLSCFVGPMDVGGRRTRAAALPVRIGRDGVAKVEVPALSANARVALDNAMLL
jgi:malate dehydrogenase